MMVDGDERGAAAINLVSVLVHVAGGPFRRARARTSAQREFEERSREEIEAWRASYLRD
jgi:hypothetical protein